MDLKQIFFGMSIKVPFCKILEMLYASVHNFYAMYVVQLIKTTTTTTTKKKTDHHY